MNLPLKLAGRRRERLRREAAERVLDELAGGGPAQATTGDSPQLTQELDAMRSIVGTLARVPEAAWLVEVGTAQSRLGDSEAASSRRPSRGGGWSQVGARGIRPLAGMLSVAGACLVAAFLAGSLTHPTLMRSHARPAPAISASAQVVLRPLAGASNRGLAVAYMRGSDQMLLRVKHLPRSAPGTYYELWLMTSDTDLVPVASFRVGAGGGEALSLVLPESPSRYRFLDVSLQHVASGVTISQDNVLRGAIPT